MNKFKDIIDEEKPRERLIKYGVKNISNEDLLSIILKTGTKNISVKNLALNVLCEIENINDLKNLTINKLINIKGIGLVKALEIISSIELGRRVYENYNNKTKKIINAKDVYNYIINKTINLEKENFYVIYLDNKSNIVDTKLLFIGNTNTCIIDFKEIFKYAHLSLATSFICVHNHPSGDINPSKNDDFNTSELIRIGKFQHIYLKDHIIMGKDNYYSYYENSDLMF